jgi:dTDP-4-amino-4,6-dideoxygalactose transaminase
MSIPVVVPMVNLRPLLAATEPEWRANLERMFERGQFILGEQVAAFESELAAAFGARFAIGTGTGTAAIELCLRAVRASAGGRFEVIAPALTSPFTAQAILAAGFKVRFADVDKETLLLDPIDVAKRVTRKTAAIVPVHLYGQPCDLPSLAALAKKTGVAMVQDACQAHGASFGERPFTSFSPWVAYSFYPTKNLPCLGDGGAVLTNNASTARLLKMLRDGGRRNDQVSRMPAINSRLDELQACYLRAFLPHLPEWNAERRRIAHLYDDLLRDSRGVKIVQRTDDSVCHLYVIQVRQRSRIRDALHKNGISTGVHYPVPLHLQPAFQDCGARRGDLPNAEAVCRRVLSLPLWPFMPENAVLRVAECVRVTTAET